MWLHGDVAIVSRVYLVGHPDHGPGLMREATPTLLSLVLLALTSLPITVSVGDSCNRGHTLAILG
jgi:hypothetical protein